MVNRTKYTPRFGEVVWINLSPQSGHEQSGRRPALVLSQQSYNEKTGMAIFCPITSQVKGYPFEIAIPEDMPLQGVILSDQVKSLDWRSRNIEFICTLPDKTVLEVFKKLVSLITP
jgi:mRNA interferase MazF